MTHQHARSEVDTCRPDAAQERAITSVTQVERALDARRPGAGEVHLVHLGFDQHLSRRNIDLLDEVRNLLPLLRRALNQERVVERIGNDARVHHATAVATHPTHAHVHGRLVATRHTCPETGGGLRVERLRPGAKRTGTHHARPICAVAAAPSRVSSARVTAAGITANARACVSTAIRAAETADAPAAEAAVACPVCAIAAVPAHPSIELHQGHAHDLRAAILEPINVVVDGADGNLDLHVELFQPLL